MTDYKVTDLTPLASTASDDVLLIVDVHDTSTPPADASGSDKKITVANLTALGGDLTGTAAAATVAKIQGTAISAPSGGTASFLNAAGGWTVPGGGGGVTTVSVASANGFAGTVPPPPRPRRSRSRRRSPDC